MLHLFSPRCTCQYHRSVHANTTGVFVAANLQYRPFKKTKCRASNPKGCVHPRGAFQQRSDVPCWTSGGMLSLSRIFVFTFVIVSLGSKSKAMVIKVNVCKKNASHHEDERPNVEMIPFGYRNPKRCVILELLSSKDQTLLVSRNAFRILDLCLHVFDCVTWLRIEVDGLRNLLWAVAMHQLFIIHEGIADIVVLWHRNCWIKPRGKILTWWV